MPVRIKKLFLILFPFSIIIAGYSGKNPFMSDNNLSEFSVLTIPAYMTDEGCKDENNIKPRNNCRDITPANPQGNPNYNPDQDGWGKVH